MTRKDLGPVSAYAIAVAEGYQGTEAQWIAELTGTTQNAQTASAKAGEAAASASAAAGSATDAAGSAAAASGSAAAAAGSATAASGSATAASGSASAASGSAAAAAADAKKAERYAKGTEDGAAVASCDGYQDNAKYYKDAAAAVAASIPQSYTEVAREALAAYTKRRAEGAVVVIRDGADGVPAASVRAVMPLVQTGANESAPDNRRPITTRTGLTLRRAPHDLMDDTTTESGSYTDDGTPSDSASGLRTGLIPVSGMTSVIVRVTQTIGTGSWTLRVHGYNAAGEWTSMLLKRTPSRTVQTYNYAVTLSGAAYIRLSYTAAADIGVYDTSLITDTAADWTDAAGAVAAGELDLTTGVLTVTHGYRSLDGTENWTASTGTNKYYTINLPGGATPEVVDDSAVCSHFMEAPTISGSNAVTGFRVFFTTSANKNRLLVRPDIESVTDTDSWKAWLAAKAAANTPVQVAYELLTPQTYQLTPAQIATLPGDNEYWNDAGSTEIVYRADPTAVQAEVSDRISTIDEPDDIAAYGLPVLYLTGDTAGMTKETAVTLSYTYGSRSGTLSCKWQGSSSLRYPKKNLNLSFDNAFDAWTDFKTQCNAWRAANNVNSRITDEKTWGEQKKYVLKADWVDPSHVRNVANARLWGQIVASRTSVDSHLAAAPNYGAIDGFPVAVVLNGRYQGVYSFTIKKDAPLLGMGEGAAEYAVSAEANAKAACWWRTTATMDPTEPNGADYDIEYMPDGVQQSTVLTSLNAAINAALNAGASWETDMASRIDVDSVIDYYIFTCCIAGYDNFGHNAIYATYDGTKWVMNAYDLDSTYGIDPYGTGWNPVWDPSNSGQNPRFDKVAGNGSTSGHRLFYLAYTYSRARLKARYQALRAGALSDANVWQTLSNLGNLIPTDLLARERALWPTLQGTSLATVSQYMDFYRMHCAALDAQVAAWEV